MIVGDPLRGQASRDTFVRRAISVYDDNSYLIEGNENKETGNKEIIMKIKKST